MATIRMSEASLLRVRQHLFGGDGERFAFLRAKWAWGPDGPAFLVHDEILVPDEQMEPGGHGWSMSTEAILSAINIAVKHGDALIEAHNHLGRRPRFSETDEQGFRDFVPYALDSLPKRPYAATVWAGERVFGRWFGHDGESGVIRSVTALGTSLRQVVSRDDDDGELHDAFDRQLPWFTATGQRDLARLRVAIVGAGGTGSHVVQQLAYLGIRDALVIDGDLVDVTSMNRLVTATHADVETAKAVLARRMFRAVGPDAKVQILPVPIPVASALSALKDVDVIFGCVDNDGARLILNELAVALAIPYFDLGVGIELDNGKVAAAGGRCAVVLPGGPCLCCMKQIDVDEASYFLASPADQKARRERGYVTGMDAPAPAVGSLNGAVASMAVNEFSIMMSGLRPVQPLSELDLIGAGRGRAGQWITPVAVKRQAGCVVCGNAGQGDTAEIERYGTIHLAARGV